MSVENQWYVRLTNGSVITVSLDDLDAAFQRGDVNEDTLVCREGMSQWLPLGEAAGLDEEVAPAPQPALYPIPQAAPSSLRAVAYDARDTRDTRDTPMAFNTYGATPARADASFDVSFDDIGAYDAPQFKSSKKKTVMILAAVAAVIGLGITGLSQLSGSDASASLADSSVASQSGAQFSSQMKAATAPPPVTQLPSTPPDAQAAGQNRLSDEQRKALLQLDDKQKSDSAKRAQDRAAKMPRSHGRRSKDKEVFVKGGSKYDPLNSSL